MDMADQTSSDTTFSLEENERIGFCFPVHGWRPPKLVRAFIQGLKLQPAAGSHYCWALCTAGDDIGITMEYLNRDLSAIGLQLPSVIAGAVVGKIYEIPHYECKGNVFLVLLPDKA